MRGLDLARNYYEDVVLKKIEELAPHILQYCAFGLVGYGSECLGFDDDISQDHDFSPNICIWMKREDFLRFSKERAEIEASLPEYFLDYKLNNESEWGSGRRGFLIIEDFYFNFLGLEREARTITEWQNIPEYFLSAATNGEVFADNLGYFTELREKMSYYPEVMRQNKIATRLMKISQAGQYNYARCLKRNEMVAANLVLSEFIEEVIHLVYLLNLTYMPFYKWSHRGLLELDLLGREVHNLLNDLVLTKKKIPLIKELCSILKCSLQKQKLTALDSEFLGDLGIDIQQNIADDFFKVYPAWMD